MRISSPALISKTTEFHGPLGEPSHLVLEVAGDHLAKNALAIIDIIVSNEWTRPIYFNFSSLNSLDIDLTPYVIQEGTLFRLGFKRNANEGIAIDTSVSYKNLIVQADYSNLSDSTIHFSYEDHFARIIVPLRHAFNDLATAFLNEGNPGKSREVIQHAVDKLYHPHLPPSYTNLGAAEILLALHDEPAAYQLSKALYAYQSCRVDMERESGISPSALDQFLLRRSAAILESLNARVDPDDL